MFGDPLNPNSLHEFGYANGNPLVFTDPLGLQGLDTCSAGGPKCPVPPAPRYPNPLSRVLRDSPTGPQTYNPTPFKPPVVTNPAPEAVSRPLWQQVLAWVGIGTTAASTVSGGLELEPGEQERKRKELEELLAHSAELHRKEEECRRGGGDRAWCQAMEFQVPDEQHIKAPGQGPATPAALPGAENDAGKVVTDEPTGQPMVAPGPDAAPMAAPGADRAQARYVAGPTNIGGYHGTTASGVLGIIDKGGLVPSRGKVFIGGSPEATFVHGVDRSKGVSYSIRVEVSLPPGASMKRTETPNVPLTTEIYSSELVPAQVTELHIRRPDGEGGFTREVVKGTQAIKEYLTR